MPSPKPLPRSASLLGPKISSATARSSRISGSPSFPGIETSNGVCPADDASLQGPQLNSRLVRPTGQRVSTACMQPPDRALRSHGLDQASHERGAAWQLRDQDVFVRGVRSVAYAAETVQGWNPEARGEIAIRATAHRRFFETPSQLAR